MAIPLMSESTQRLSIVVYQNVFQPFSQQIKSPQECIKWTVTLKIITFANFQVSSRTYFFPQPGSSSLSVSLTGATFVVKLITGSELDCKGTLCIDCPGLSSVFCLFFLSGWELLELSTARQPGSANSAFRDAQSRTLSLENLI